MKLLVIGHSVLDHIKEPSGFRFQPGGIFYTTLALSTLKDKDDEFFLCTLTEAENAALFDPAFNCFDKRFSSATDRIPRVHLTIMDEKERCERFENLNKKVVLPAGRLDIFDGILINMISGYEIDLADLIYLRQNYQGPIYLDVHSMARGVGEGMVREFRKINEFEKWASNLTIVQANECELATLTEYRDESDIITFLLQTGLICVLVTKGEKGAAMYLKKGDIVENSIFNIPRANVINKVGCGDLFGAYFFYYYIKNRKAEEAFKMAVSAGSCATQYGSISEFLTLKEDVAKLYD